MKSFFREFKQFISRGNILDLAVGVIIGGAFSAIVTAFTNQIIRPLINWVLSAIVGGGLDKIYTYLTKVFVLDELGNPTTTIDLTKSIYIDWGAFISAIIDFLIIAFVLFAIMKAFNSASNLAQKKVKECPTKAERKQLKAEGVNMKDYKAVVKATAELRERNKPAPEPPKPTQEELLTDILEELKKQNQPKEKAKKSKNEE